MFLLFTVVEPGLTFISPESNNINMQNKPHTYKQIFAGTK